MCSIYSFIFNLNFSSDPNAMAVGPPVNDITAPPTTGGLGMIPTGLANAGRRATQSTANSTMMMGDEGGGGERFDDEYSSKTTFSSGSSGSGSGSGDGGSSGGWWPFGGS